MILVLVELPRNEHRKTINNIDDAMLIRVNVEIRRNTSLATFNQAVTFRCVKFGQDHLGTVASLWRP